VNSFKHRIVNPYLKGDRYLIYSIPGGKESKLTKNPLKIIKGKAIILPKALALSLLSPRIEQSNPILNPA